MRATRPAIARWGRAVEWVVAKRRPLVLRGRCRGLQRCKERRRCVRSRVPHKCELRFHTFRHDDGTVFKETCLTFAPRTVQFMPARVCRVAHGRKAGRAGETLLVAVRAVQGYEMVASCDDPEIVGMHGSPPPQVRCTWFLGCSTPVRAGSGGGNSP